MATARKHILPDHSIWIHCTSRCVRRAYLCGGRDGKYDHRRQWVEDRLRELAGIFAVEIASYAVMSNHVHVVLRMSPETAERWSAKEVADRWLAVYGRNVDRLTEGGKAKAVSHLAANAEWIAERRTRLAKLDWFMRAFKEPLARRANVEDECTGSFWEGRFSSVPLYDQAALVACMAYVDLNPVRAKMAATPEASTHTAVRSRIRSRQRTRVVRRLRERGGNAAQVREAATKAGIPAAEQTLVEDNPEHGLFTAPMKRCVARWEGQDLAKPLTTDDYLTLVDATGRVLRAGKRGVIDPRLAPILSRLDLKVEDWIATMCGWRQMHGRLLASAETRKGEATRRGLQWIRNRCPLFAARKESAA
jgi:REP element-mobilizing transposase RayT